MPENGKMCIWYRGQNVKTVQRGNYVSSLFKCLLVILQWSGGLVNFITKYSWEATWSQVASRRSQSWARDVKRSLAVSIFSLFAFPWLTWPTPGLVTIFPGRSVCLLYCVYLEGCRLLRVIVIGDHRALQEAAFGQGGCLCASAPGNDLVITGSQGQVLGWHFS